MVNHSLSTEAINARGLHLSTSVRVGVFVDAENIRYNGGYQMRYDVLRRFAARNGGVLQRLNTYMA